MIGRCSAEPRAAGSGANTMRAFTNSDKTFLTGRLAEHANADPFVRTVLGFLARYVNDVVVEHGLCPFVGGDGNALGTVVVILDDAPRAEDVATAVRATGAQVLHVVTPLLVLPSNRFERFASSVAEAYRAGSNRAPGDPTLVHAAFHPEMAGGAENAHRMVGLVRRAPDPFIQFIPSGIQGGGTMFGALHEVTHPAHAAVQPVAPVEGHGDRTYRRLGASLDDIARTLAEMRAERDAAYAPHVAALGL